MEEANAGNGVHLSPGSWRLSPSGATHHVRSSRPTKCRNIHIHDPRLARRLSASLPAHNHFLHGSRLVKRSEGELGLYELVAQACRILDERENNEPPSWLREARAHVLIGHDPLEKIAAGFLTTREHFCRVFAGFYGCSPKQARQIAVLERVHHRLIATDEQLADIALDEGFYDQAHMTGTVRRTWGVTPSAVRRSAQTSHFSNTR